mmetsp:Transcript_102280/g.305400  ORF Transcript_102280/g.305400 Transcript_102280/m.305400 type:complete len:251 (-) Transcript_102280:527-1279(-)
MLPFSGFSFARSWGTAGQSFSGAVSSPLRPGTPRAWQTPCSRGRGGRPAGGSARGRLQLEVPQCRSISARRTCASCIAAASGTASKRPLRRDFLVALAIPSLRLSTPGLQAPKTCCGSPGHFFGSCSRQGGVDRLSRPSLSAVGGGSSRGEGGWVASGCGGTDWQRPGLGDRPARASSGNSSALDVSRSGGAGWLGRGGLWPPEPGEGRSSASGMRRSSSRILQRSSSTSRPSCGCSSVGFAASTTGAGP